MFLSLHSCQAVSSKKMNRVEILLKEKGLNLILEDKNGCTPFFYASKANLKMMECVLKATKERYGENLEKEIINKANKKGETPLMAASQLATPQGVKVL